MDQSLEAKIAMLRMAIKQLKQVSGSYDGYPREFCPHLLGRKDGAWKCLTWQFDGASRTGKIPDWRDFDLSKLSDLSLRDGDWHRGWETGRRAQNAVDQMDTVVDPEHAAEIRHTSPPRTPTRAPQRLNRRK